LAGGGQIYFREGEVIQSILGMLYFDKCPYCRSKNIRQDEEEPYNKWVCYSCWRDWYLEENYDYKKKDEILYSKNNR